MTNSNDNLLIKPCKLTAFKDGLIEYLEDRTQIDWRYYKSSIVPSAGAKAGIKVARGLPILPEGNFRQDTWEKKLATYQLRLLLANTESEDECEALLLGWQDLLDRLILKVAFQGLQGTWRNIEITNGLMGIAPSNKGFQIAIEETIADQQDETSIWVGALFLEYNYLYENDFPSLFN